MKKIALFLMVLQVPIDYLMLLLAALSAYALRFSDWAMELRTVQFGLTLTEFLTIAVQVGALWILIFAVNGLYIVDPHQKFSKSIGKIFFACSTGIALVALYLLFSQEAFDSRFLVAASWVCSVLFVLLGRMMMRGVKAILYRCGIGLSRVAFIGDRALMNSMREELQKRKELGYTVIATYDTFDDAVGAELLTQQVDDIIFVNPRANEQETLAVLEWAQEHHIGFRYSADLFATFTTQVQVYPLAGVPIVEIRRTSLDGWGKVVKRAFDIIGSIALSVLFAPIMILTAIAIKLDSKGPVLFSYERIGEHGVPFRYFKFRSMVDRAHELRYDASFREQVEDLRAGTPIIKYKDDPRITRVGKIIRRYSIDELPEFFLVLLGRMSLVGPRPHEAREVAAYERHHKRVLTIKPGITGLSQISGRSDLSFEDEVRLDVFYIEHWTFLLDLIILLKTPFVLFRRRKAL